MERKRASDFSPEVLRLFDGYVHGGISRRDFLDRAGKYAIGGMTAATMLAALEPNYALAQQVPRDDARIQAETITYQSPQGYGPVKGYFVKPAKVSGKIPGVVVVHENRGLNPYIEDVARRVATAGFMALAPDGLTSLGGYPGDDQKGAEMQRSLDGARLLEDFVAAAQTLMVRPDCSGKVGVVGFCYGGGVANQLAVRLPGIKAAVPFYGNQPKAEDAAKIKAELLLHYAEMDERIDAGWPAYEAALKQAGVKYQAFVYPGVNHGFHNDTTPRYDKGAATLAWDRTIAFFNRTLKA